MSDINRVEMQGTVIVNVAKPATENKKAFVKGAIKLSRGGFIPVVAFEKAAEDFGNAKDLTATVVGELGWDRAYKKADGTEVKPQLHVVIRTVSVQAPAQKDEGIPF